MVFTDVGGLHKGSGDQRPRRPRVQVLATMRTGVPAPEPAPAEPVVPVAVPEELQAVQAAPDEETVRPPTHPLHRLLQMLNDADRQAQSNAWMLQAASRQAELEALLRLRRNHPEPPPGQRRHARLRQRQQPDEPPQEQQ